MAGNRLTRKTTTIERLDGDSTAGKLKDGMKEYARLTLEGYTEAYWRSVDEPSARLDVFKKLGGQMMKKGDIQFQQVEPEEVENFIIATWGVGTYQLRPLIGGKYYAPASVPYKVGDQGDDEGKSVTGDGTEELLGKLAIAQQLKGIKESLVGGEGDGMKPGDMQAMMNATIAPLTAMLESANRRAEAAEQRNHEMQMKMLDMAQNKTAAGGPVWAEMLKLLPKEAVTALLAPPEGPGWMEHVVSALREFGPALTQLIVEHFKGAAPASAPALPASASSEPQPSEPGPSSAGNGAMPLTLSEEQVEAKKMLLDCIREKDFPNAYAMLENFPGFVPTHQGPMPIGPAFLGMVDPTVTRPRIYVIQMMQLAPELRDMMQEADAFIGYVQKRLMADQEAALAAERRADRPDAGPRPSTSGHREEDDRG